MQLKQTLFMSATIIALALGHEGVDAKTGGEKEESRKLLDPANMDTSIKPGDNFFLYANGTWLKNNPIPKSETRWGSFNELQENNYKALHRLLDSAAAIKNAPKGSLVQKVGDFYRTGMDSASINKAGISPLKSLLA